MEMEKVPQAGYEIKGFWISGFQRKLTLKNLMFPFKLISSLWNARKIIKYLNLMLLLVLVVLQVALYYMSRLRIKFQL